MIVKNCLKYILHELISGVEKILFIALMSTSLIGFACHSTNISSVSSINNGNNTTTFTIDLTVDVGTLDGYSYGFALIFENNSSVSPIVLSNPTFTASLSRSGYNNLVGYTGSAIGSGLGATSSNYFDDRYGNRTDVLTYETDDDWFGFGSTSYSQTVVVTVQGCVENIKLDGDFRSTGSATAQGDPDCINNYLTGISCSTTCTSTPNLIFNGAAQYNSSCTICDRHNNNPPSCSCPSCGDITTCGGYTACNGNENDNSLDNNTNEFKLTHNCNCLGGSIWNDIELDLNKNFTIEAELWFGSNNSRGADGIAFVLQTDPNTTNNVSTGGSVGHGNLAPAFIFEFDSHQNSADPSTDHFQLITSLNQVSGNNIRDFVNFSTNLNVLTNNSVSLNEIEDGNWHLIRIDWESDPDNNPNTTEGRLNVFFDANDDGDIDDPSDHLISDFDYDLINTVFSNENGKVFWGFTSATGCFNNLHKIRNLNPIIPVDFSYNSYSFCSSDNNPVATITGESNGIFSGAPTGIVINSTTGEIDLDASDPGNYTVRYEINANCFVEKQVEIGLISTIAAIDPTNANASNNLVANLTNSQCVDASTNDWRLNGTSIATRNYSFNANETTQITDYSTHSNSGTINGTINWVNGYSGGARNFTNGPYITAGTGAFTQEFTFSAWIFPRQTTGTVRTIFSQTNNERFIFIQDGIIGIQFKDETANPIYWPSVYGDINIFEILPNNWYHVAVTRSLNNDINIYVNGILTRSVLNSGLIYVDNTGINYIGSEGTSSRRFDGIIDEVIVMDRAVSANQITAMFNDDVNSYFTIHSDETNCGETWTLNSTPFDASGVEGTPDLSSPVTLTSMSISTQPVNGADVCQGNAPNAMSVVASNGSGSYNYQWYECDDLLGSNQTAINGETNNSFTPPFNTPGTFYYLVEVTDQDPGCGAEFSIVVSQKVDENITTDAGPDQIICGNELATLSGSITGGTSTGNWSSSGTGAFDNTSSMTAVYTPSSSDISNGSVTLTLTSDINGACPAVSDDLILTINSIPWANLQWPPDGSICPSGSFNAFGRIFVDNVTQGAGAGQNITAEIGYSTSNTNPNLWTNWVSATYNLDDGNNDEYIGTLSGLSAGTYYYAFRYSYQSCDYVYGGFSFDVNGGGAGGIWDGITYTSGVLTVNSTDATFTYPQCCYFTTDTDPTPIPTVTGIAGTYSCSDNNLAISNDGTIDLDASSPGLYTITHTLINCPVTSNQNVLISLGNNCNTPTFTPLSDPSNQVVASNLGNNEYQLTPNTPSVRGAIWCDQPINLNYSFTISSQLYFGDNNNGADGISFVLHQYYQPNPVGSIGYYLFDPSIAVEFDTYYNNLSTNFIDQGAPSTDHMAVQLNGNRDHQSSTHNLLPPVDLGNIEDDQYHDVVLNWDVNSLVFSIYLDNNLIGTVNRDLRNDFTGLVYWGFASSTGAAYSLHKFKYVNSSFWYGRDETDLNDVYNQWQGDVNSPTEMVTDPIDNTSQYTTASWFNPCNWSASFVPDYDTDVVIPQQSNYTNHPIVNYNTSIFSNHSVLNFDMDRDGDIDSDDQVQGKGFAKSLKTEGDGLFFIKSDDGDPTSQDAELQIRE